MTNKLPLDFTLDRYGLHVRFVWESDAEFIVRLRTDKKLGRFINATTPNLDAQRDWTKRYKEREARGEDYYFVFETPKGVPVGLCRIYDINPTYFSVGSWLFSPEAPMGAAILADIITREIAYELYPNSTHYFDVKIANTNVNRYNETYKSELLSHDEHTNYYTCSKENFEKYKKLHLRMFTPKK